MLSKKPMPPTEYTSPFADFIRNAKSGEKKRVYRQVLVEATKKQNEVVLVAHLKQALERQ